MKNIKRINELTPAEKAIHASVYGHGAVGVVNIDRMNKAFDHLQQASNTVSWEKRLEQILLARAAR